MNRYLVTIARTITETVDVEVTAFDLEQAKEIALDDADNREWTEASNGDPWVENSRFVGEPCSPDPLDPRCHVIDADTDACQRCGMTEAECGIQASTQAEVT